MHTTSPPANCRSAPSCTSLVEKYISSTLTLKQDTCALTRHHPSPPAPFSSSIYFTISHLFAVLNILWYYPTYIFHLLYTFYFFVLIIFGNATIASTMLVITKQLTTYFWPNLQIQNAYLDYRSHIWVRFCLIVFVKINQYSCLLYSIGTRGTLLFKPYGGSTLIQWIHPLLVLTSSTEKFVPRLQYFTRTD